MRRIWTVLLNELLLFDDGDAGRRMKKKEGGARGGEVP